MLRTIITYFLLVFCLLTKESVSLTFDLLREKSAISSEMNFEDSMEEDGIDDLMASEDLSVDLNENNLNGFADKSIVDQYKKSTLHVLLELESPPPRMA
jgi:hypothetical protein